MTPTAATERIRTTWRGLWDVIRLPAPTATPRGAWWLALLVAAALLGSLLLGQSVLGRFPFGDAGEPRDFRLAVVHCLLIGYLVGAFGYVMTGARETMRSLRGRLDLDEAAFQIVLGRVGKYPVAALGILAVAGVLVSLMGPYLTDPPYPAGFSPWDPQAWTVEVTWHRMLSFGIGWGISWLALAVIVESKRLARVADSLTSISLWDTQHVTPFTHQGLRNALVVLGLLSVFALFVPEQGITPAFLVILGLAAVLAVVGLLLPVRGVRSVIRQAKQRELAWATRMIEQERLGLANGHSAAGRSWRSSC